MMDDPSFGSSEYSHEAVELFAQYLLARDVGEDVDFEAFAEEHDAFTEELYGLHTDWDNVRGLLERLRARPAPAPVVVEPPAAAAEVVEAPTVELELALAGDPQPVRPAGRAWRVAAVATTLVALSLGYVTYTLHNAKVVLAGESERLAGEGRRLSGLLDEERSALNAKQEQLAQEQRAREEALREVERTREALERERRAAEALRVATLADVLLESPALRGVVREAAPALREWLSKADAWASEAQGSADAGVLAAAGRVAEVRARVERELACLEAGTGAGFGVPVGVVWRDGGGEEDAQLAAWIGRPTPVARVGREWKVVVLADATGVAEEVLARFGYERLSVRERAVLAVMGVSGEWGMRGR